MKSIVGLGHCGCCLFHLAWLLQLWIFCVFWPSIAPFNKPLKNINLEVVDGVAIWTFLTLLCFSFARGKKGDTFGLCLKGGKEDIFIFHGARKEEYPLNLSLFFSHTLSRKSFSFTIATPCTMHLGGVSCSIISSTVNPSFPQSPRWKIPYNGFLNS